MATIYYIRESSKQGSMTSSREVSVPDLLSLYGSSPSGYEFMKGVDSPVIGSGGSPPHVLVRIESNEAVKDTFPAEGFYRVRDVKPT